MPLDSTAPILDYLQIEPAAPTAGYLSAILTAWNQRIPWESASRIARHRTPDAPYRYARDAGRFFADALSLNTGGTCFETNTALKALLDALGFESTFALCDMDDSRVADPHCALVATIDGARYIADAGWPLPVALPLAAEPLAVDVPIYTYHIEPMPDGRWRIWRSSGDFTQACFYLKPAPVPPDTFRARLVRDHFDDGLFLDNVIVSRMIDGRILRFDQTKGLIERVPGAEVAVPWTDRQAADIPAALHEIYGMDIGILREALAG